MVAIVTGRPPVASESSIVETATPAPNSPPRTKDYVFPQDSHDIAGGALRSIGVLATEMLEGVVGCAQRAPRLLADHIGKVALDVPPQAVGWFFDDRPWWKLI